jgi:hypothetical protein
MPARVDLHAPAPLLASAGKLANSYHCTEDRFTANR